MFFKGFDNNGVMIGPRSTRQSNPEEHASHYFNTFSKDMLVQVRFQEDHKYRSPQENATYVQKFKSRFIPAPFTSSLGFVFMFFSPIPISLSFENSSQFY